MTFQRIQEEDKELFSVETHPYKFFTSSSFSGSFGDVPVFYQSPRQKDQVSFRYADPTNSTGFSDENLLGQILSEAKHAGLENGNNYGEMENYFSASNLLTTSPEKFGKKMTVLRFVPGTVLDKNMLRKKVVVDNMFKFYRSTFPGFHYNYTNYNCLNFFSDFDGSNTIPTGSCLLYSNPLTYDGERFLGPYIPTSSFCFDFWINPRYSTTQDSESFKAGTILHLSSCYAISLVSGSSRDGFGRPDKFRILFQASSSAGIKPSSLNLNTANDLIFTTEDNSLNKGQWHHVAISWGGVQQNLGSGSIYVDGVEKCSFNIPSSSIIPNSFLPTRDDPTVLTVGNFYEGTNQGSSVQAYFFSTDTSEREGLDELIVDSGFSPANFQFNHPLNAEIHELKLYGKYRTKQEICKLSGSGPENTNDLLFYLPPFFTTKSPNRKHYNGFGGVLETPFYAFNGTTDTPFSNTMAFSVGGHYSNLENHTREFVNGKYPRLWQLSGSEISTTISVPQTANQLLYATSSVVKRSLTVLPCDNGLFVPNFKTFLTEDVMSLERSTNDLGNRDHGIVSLRNLIPTSSSPSLISSSIFLSDLAGADVTGNSMTLPVGETYSVLQRTGDNTSNQVVFFDVSNLFYGDQIQPGSLTLVDSQISGSNGKVRITLKDDGRGNIYRSDVSGSKSAIWNNVGNVLYNEGIVVLKNPALYFFGEQQFSISFKGHRNVHVMHYNLMAYPGAHVSSSNPSYIPVSSSLSPNEPDKRFAYITNINIRDENLNIIMKTTLAQPIAIKSGERLMFKPRIDF